MAKIAFIGKERILKVGTYLGTSIFPVSNPQEAEATLLQLIEDTDAGKDADDPNGNQWGIVYIEEGLAEAFLEKIIELNKRPLPVISLFPSTGEKKELSGKILNNLVRKVTGVELTFD